MTGKVAPRALCSDLENAKKLCPFDLQAKLSLA